MSRQPSSTGYRQRIPDPRDARLQQVSANIVDIPRPKRGRSPSQSTHVHQCCCLPSRFKLRVESIIADCLNSPPAAGVATVAMLL